MDELDKDNKINIKTGLSSAEQLAKIGVAKSVPQTMINMLDKNRQLMSRLYDELENEELVLTQMMQHGSKDYVNPKIEILFQTQRVYNDTVRAIVTVADIVESKRLRPSEEVGGKKEHPSGIQIDYVDYSAKIDDAATEEKLISPKEQMEALKQAKLSKKKSGGK